MAFSNEQIIKLAGNVLAAGTLDSSGSNWYEQRNPNNFIIDPETIWSDLPLMKDYHAANWAEVVANVNAAPEYFGFIGVNPDGSYDDATAIRMTPVAGTNNATYIAYNEYNNPASGVQKSWIQPQLLPRPNGAPSAAYQATIWSGPPSQGNRILTSTGNDGNWVSHFWNAAGGLLLISPNDAPPSSSFPSTDLYVTGVIYTGNTSTGGGVSGTNIILQDPDGNWRIINDYPHLRFQRRDIDNQGNVRWNNYANIGSSVETDGITLARPYDINVNLAADALNDNEDPDLKAVFKVSGTENEFKYGNSSQQTVIETKKGTEVEREVALRQEVLIINRPENDLNVLLDNTDTPESGSSYEISWISDINYTEQTDYIRFNELMFDVIEVKDSEGQDVDFAPVRISVETLEGDLIQENLSVESLNAGINGDFNLKVGKHFYTINPKYSDIRLAQTITRLVVAKGYKVRLKAGNYTYEDQDGVEQTQLVPYQQAKVDFLDHVDILDESNYKRLIHENSKVILDSGLHTFYEGWSENTHQIVGIGEHVSANNPVLGNYEDTTYVATGTGGLVTLFQDDSTRKQLWTEGDKQRILEDETPTYFVETKSLEIDLEGIFASELEDLKWKAVNVEKFLPLIRYEGEEDQGYRVSIYSKILDGYKFQENMTSLEYEDRVISSKHILSPTVDPINPVYKELNLPRRGFTVNNSTPRKILFEFQEPVKVYGYYKDPTDPSDPASTGTFIPSIKAEVLRVFEQPVVVGDDLEERVDQIQGEQEWAYATENSLSTLHLVPSLLWLADENGEALLFSDLTSLYSDQDEHQWLFSTGTEAYYEPTISQSIERESGRWYLFNPLVVHVPYENVASFSVSFGWHESFSNLTNLEYGRFTFYIASHGRGKDALININVPVNASITYYFSKRRDGRYSYRAAPHNDNLASTVVEGNQPYPPDPNPPIEFEDPSSN